MPRSWPLVARAFCVIVCRDFLQQCMRKTDGVQKNWGQAHFAPNLDIMRGSWTMMTCIRPMVGHEVSFFKFWWFHNARMVLNDVKNGNTLLVLECKRILSGESLDTRIIIGQECPHKHPPPTPLQNLSYRFDLFWPRFHQFLVGFRHILCIISIQICLDWKKCVHFSFILFLYFIVLFWHSFLIECLDAVMHQCRSWRQGLN